MSTALKEKKEKRPAEPAGSAPARSAWCDKVIRATHALLHAKDYLTPPPADTPLADILDARDSILDPDALERQRRDAFLTHAIFGGQGPQVDPSTGIRRSEIDPNPEGSALDRLAGEMASPPGGRDERKEFIRDTVLAVLHEIDAAIATALRSGQRDERIIFIPPSKLFAIGGSEFGFDVELTGCYASDLGEQADFEWFKASNGKPAAVLAPMVGSIAGRQTHRAWFLASTARWWTARIALAQRKKRRQSAQTFDDYLKLQSDGLDIRQPLAVSEPKLPRPEDVLGTVQPPDSWLARLKLALDVGRRFSHHFRPPDAEESVDALLQVRLALDVRDHELEANRFAAERFAGVVGGGSRHEDLRDWLRAVMSTINPIVQRATSNAVRWAILKAHEESSRGR